MSDFILIYIHGRNCFFLCIFSFIKIVRIIFIIFTFQVVLGFSFVILCLTLFSSNNVARFSVMFHWWSSVFSWTVFVVYRPSPCHFDNLHFQSCFQVFFCYIFLSYQESVLYVIDGVFYIFGLIVIGVLWPMPNFIELLKQKKSS